MLATLAGLKQRLEIEDATVKYDTTLKLFLQGVSSRFQTHCNRAFDRSDAATWCGRGDDMNLPVDRFPIEAVTAFELKSNEAEGWITQPDVDYLINETRSIIELASPLGNSRQILRVTFAGGYVLPGATVQAGQEALPDAVMLAALEQAAYFWQNKDRLGLVSISTQGGAISQFAQLDLLPSVKAALRQYERFHC